MIRVKPWWKRAFNLPWIVVQMHRIQGVSWRMAFRLALVTVKAKNTTPQFWDE